MNVCVRLFAAIGQAAGCDRLELQLPEKSTVGRLRRRLVEELPELSELIGRAVFAIDTEYASDVEEITPDADVACIPPVSGG